VNSSKAFWSTGIDWPSLRSMIRAVSNDGDAELVETFDTDGERWAVVSFWYYSEEEGDGGGGQSFSFEMAD
jgi:hypothetical protein